MMRSMSNSAIFINYSTCVRRIRDDRQPTTHVAQSFLCNHGVSMQQAHVNNCKFSELINWTKMRKKLNLTHKISKQRLLYQRLADWNNLTIQTDKGH